MAEHYFHVGGHHGRGCLPVAYSSDYGSHDNLGCDDFQDY